MAKHLPDLNVRRHSMPTVIVALTIVACGAGAPVVASPSATAAAVGGALVQRLSGDWASLDPFEPGTTNSNQVLAAV